jgi:phosphopantetheinyl transferase (holo-ACP synthase)
VISAGNDIVALNLIDQQRTILPVFYSKFITPAELSLHGELDIPFENFVWFLWSVKESAYKYLKRSEVNLLFLPSKLVVKKLAVSDKEDTDYLDTDQSVDKYCEGVVSNGINSLAFKSAINHQFIVTIINEGNVYWGVQTIDKSDYETQSKSVRLFALAKLNNLIVADDLWIDKHPSGYPFIISGIHQPEIPLSFAHHGCYVSYAFQLSQ